MPCVLTIDLGAIRRNLQCLRRHLGSEARILAVVKANAYGTGLVEFAPQLEAFVDAFAVAQTTEALLLRSLGIRKDILLLVPPSPSEWPALLASKIDVAVGSTAQVQAASQAAQACGTSARLHLNVDTGMGRHGALPSTVMELARLIAKLPGVHMQGFMSHPSCADCLALDTHSLAQRRLFDTLRTQVCELTRIKPLCHFANSASALRWPQTAYDMVRIGLALFGVYTSSELMGLCDLELAVQLDAPILDTRILPASWPVGYGATQQAALGGQRIATLGIGYHDGLHRYLGAKGTVEIQGKQVPFVGRISMDACVIDISELPQIEAGDRVTIFGPTARPELLAESGGGIPHELLAALGPRIQRNFTLS